MSTAAPETNAWRLPNDFAVEHPVEGDYTSKTLKDFRFVLNSEDFLPALQKGTTFYSFNCGEGKTLGSYERELITRVINLTSFSTDHPDAVADIDMEDATELKQIFMLNKAMYILPKVTINDVSPEKLAQVELQKNCQPGVCKVWEDCDRGDTFRITKTIVRAIFKMTIQFRCSELPADCYPSLELINDGLKIDKALLMERTKRDESHVDSTKKVRSLLLYHALADGGLVVTNFTVAVNTSVPTALAKLVDKLGWAGAGEVAETATKTRDYILKKKI